MNTYMILRKFYIFIMVIIFIHMVDKNVRSRFFKNTKYFNNIIYS